MDHQKPDLGLMSAQQLENRERHFVSLAVDYLTLGDKQRSEECHAAALEARGAAIEAWAKANRPAPDPVQAWIDERIVFASTDDAWLSVSDLLADYKEWCRRSDIFPVNTRPVIRRLENDPSGRVRRAPAPTPTSQHLRGFAGISWATDGPLTLAAEAPEVDAAA